MIEAITLRCTVTSAGSRPPFARLPARDGRLAPHGVRRVVYATGALDTPVYVREALCAGDRIDGPALIEEAASVTVLAPHHRLEVTASGHLVVTLA